MATPSGAQVALGQLARVGVVKGPTLIKSEDATLNNIVYVDVQGRDIGGYVAEARRLLDERLALPQGYRLEWSGQFESMEGAAKRMRVVVPITLAIIAWAGRRPARRRSPRSAAPRPGPPARRRARTGRS